MEELSVAEPRDKQLAHTGGNSMEGADREQASDGDGLVRMAVANILQQTLYAYMSWCLMMRNGVQGVRTMPVARGWMTS
jgi:hypothetical protein